MSTFNPIDTERMIIDSSPGIFKDYTTGLMKDFSIDLNFHEYNNKDYFKIFISKSKDQLFFPKFFNVQSNYKCLLDTEFDKFILILQNIRPDLIYLNESIQIHFRENNLNDLNDIYIPKINIIENKTLPRLIIVPINIWFYNKDNIRISGHKNIIIINNLLETITYFEPYGINFNVKNVITFNILKKYYTTFLPSYTFINAASGSYSKNVIDIDFYVNDIYDNYYRKIKEYQNHLADIKLSFSEKEYKSEKNIIKNKIKKLRKYIKNIKHKKKDSTKMLVDYTPDMLTNNGQQKIQEFIETFGKDGIGGHCVGWSLYIVFLTFININLFTKKFDSAISLSSFINNLFLEKINNESLKPDVLSNMIRYFIEYVHRFNEHYEHFILTKSKSSKVVNIKFNTQGGFTVVPPSPIYDTVEFSIMNLNNN
jgi:hypothetical protein